MLHQFIEKSEGSFRGITKIVTILSPVQAVFACSKELIKKR